MIYEIWFMIFACANTSGSKKQSEQSMFIKVINNSSKMVLFFFRNNISQIIPSNVFIIERAKKDNRNVKIVKLVVAAISCPEKKFGWYEKIHLMEFNKYLCRSKSGIKEIISIKHKFNNIEQKANVKEHKIIFEIYLATSHTLIFLIIFLSKIYTIQNEKINVGYVNPIKQMGGVLKNDPALIVESNRKVNIHKINGTKIPIDSKLSKFSLLKKEKKIFENV